MLNTLYNSIQTDLVFYQQAGVLLIALLLAQFIYVPRASQPWYWFGRMAKSFAEKVNHIHRSDRQRKIAGLLASIILILPIWLTVTLLISLAEYPWFFEALVLFCCLMDTSFSKDAAKIAKDISQQKNASAKARLRLWCERDCHNLSAIGLVKATIEHLAKRNLANTISIALYYSLGGISLVLATTMLKQLEFVWPTENPKFDKFNRYLLVINHIFQVIPFMLAVMFICLYKKMSAIKILFSGLSAGQRLSQLAIQQSAALLNIELGGPHRYAQQQVSHIKYCYGSAPQWANISEVSKLLRIEQLLTFSIVISTMFFMIF
ncbi:MAG: cobalamin biosynthesis protein CobD/CbiB [Parashewanella sp.]